MLEKEIIKLTKSEINNLVESRLKEFSSFKGKSEDEWFSELCFCLLTANAKQKTGAAIQKQLQAKGFLTLDREKIVQVIKENKHRFHNNKAKYIVEARRFANIKSVIEGKSSQESREFLVNNLKGLGMKEASHFLRNTGTTDLAILDRHILNLMSENNLITRPKSLNKSSYLEIEKQFNSLAQKLSMTPAKLDLLMWYLKTGEVAK